MSFSTNAPSTRTSTSLRKSTRTAHPEKYCQKFTGVLDWVNRYAIRLCNAMSMGGSFFPSTNLLCGGGAQRCSLPCEIAGILDEKATVFMTWIRTIPMTEADEKLRQA